LLKVGDIGVPIGRCNQRSRQRSRFIQATGRQQDAGLQGDRLPRRHGGCRQQRQRRLPVRARLARLALCAEQPAQLEVGPRQGEC